MIKPITGAKANEGHEKGLSRSGVKTAPDHHCDERDEHASRHPQRMKAVRHRSQRIGEAERNEIAEGDRLAVGAHIDAHVMGVRQAKMLNGMKHSPAVMIRTKTER